MHRNKHYLEHAVERLAQLVQAEEHVEDMSAWVIVALAAALDVPVVVGEFGQRATRASRPPAAPALPSPGPALP